jgi:phosphopantetheine adenylyltransferase
MTNRKLSSALHSIGFTSFVRLRPDERDGKKRLTWIHPIENHKECFTVILVEENNKLQIEKLADPFGKTFEKSDVAGLIKYIKETIFKHHAETDT